MFQLNREHYYEVPDWARFEWLRHGFGTRDAEILAHPLATVRQVHGREVRIATHEGPQGTGDGLIAGVDGLTVGVRTADCLPLLLVDPVRRVVSAVHAGWRGTVAQIAGEAVSLMKERYGCEPSQMEAAIGPGIGICCFEVGPEVAREFGPWPSDEKTKLDLSRINREQLERLGLATVYESRLCTMCGVGFYSYRREKDQAGRMLSFIGRTT